MTSWPLTFAQWSWFCLGYCSIPNCSSLFTYHFLYTQPTIHTMHKHDKISSVWYTWWYTTVWMMGELRVPWKLLPHNISIYIWCQGIVWACFYCLQVPYVSDWFKCSDVWFLVLATRGVTGRFFIIQPDSQDVFRFLVLGVSNSLWQMWFRLIQAFGFLSLGVRNRRRDRLVFHMFSPHMLDMHDKWYTPMLGFTKNKMEMKKDYEPHLTNWVTLLFL